MPSCAFEDMPNEILFQIVQDASLRSRELPHLSLTSRRLHSIANLCLYHSVVLIDFDINSRRLPKFFHAIISRPELGAITRFLHIQWCFGHFMDLHDLDDGQLIIIQKLGHEKGMSTRAVSELGRGWYRPYFSLLIHLLPKLESLELGQVGAFTSLPGLNDFRATSVDAEGSTHSSEGDAKTSEDSEEERWGLFRSLRHVERSSKLKKLSFYRAVPMPSFLWDILQIPEALDTFRYDYSPSGGDYEIDAIREMANALRNHANSLTTLSLTLIGLRLGLAADLSPIVPFRDFPLLKELTVSRVFFFGLDPPRGCTAFFDLLPSNLTSLTVELGNLVDENNERQGGLTVRRFLDAIQDDEDGVRRWNRVRDQRVPHLKTFSLWIWEDPIDVREELETLGIIIHPLSCWR